MKKKWMTILVVVACVVTILASTSTAISNLRNRLDKNNSDDSATAYYQVL